MTSATPKYLTCPCGYPLSETVIPGKSHTYHCQRCGYRREKTNG